MALSELTKGTGEQVAMKPLRAPRRGNTTLRQDISAYLFLLPYLLLFGIFTMIPAIVGVAISFFHWDIIGTPTFVGMQNFQQIFADPQFRSSVVNTFFFMILAALPLILLGLALAVLLNQKLHGRAIVRAIVYLPNVVMISAVGIIWVWMYDQNWGLINYYLSKVGIAPIGWLTDVHSALPAIAITTIWWTVGNNAVIYLAGLQGIPDELYEAAKVDGAGAWSLFWHITLPMLMPVSSLVIPLTIIACWRVFGQSYVMTQGGPQGSTFVITQYIYQTAFQNFQMGAASAAAVMLLLITLTFTVIQLRVLRTF